MLQFQAQNHPEHPKKPLSAYLIFYMEKKNEVLNSQPGLAMVTPVLLPRSFILWFFNENSVGAVKFYIDFCY